jgi:hypothetical protein
MSIAIYDLAPGGGRDADAERRYICPAVTRAVRALASAINEGREVVLTMAGALAITVAFLALDAWIWIPGVGH